MNFELRKRVTPSYIRCNKMAVGQIVGCLTFLIIPVFLGSLPHKCNLIMNYTKTTSTWIMLQISSLAGVIGNKL